MSINSENDKVYKSRVDYKQIGGVQNLPIGWKSSEYQSEQKEVNLYDTRSNIAKKCVLAIVCIAALYYLVWGSIQYKKSRDEHSVKTYVDGINTNLTIPITMACQPVITPNTSFVEIAGFVIDSTALTPDEMQVVTDWNQMLTFNKWQRLQFDILNAKVINYTNPLNITYIFVDYQCEMIIPPTNVLFKHEIIQTWLYYAEGMDTKNPYLTQNFDVHMPNFLVRDFEYKILQRTAHFDEIIHQAKKNADSSKITMGDVVATMFDYGNELYGAPWSAVPIELSLITHSYLTDHGFYTTTNDVNKYIVTQNGVLTVVGGANQKYEPNTSLVYFIMTPKLLGGSVSISNQSFSYPKVIFYHEYNEEYLKYSFTDLLSGIGGFASSIMALCSTICAIILSGFVIYKWKFKGYAPYPSLNKKTEEQIRRLFHKLMEEERQKHEIQTQQQ